ncbi:MAG: GNAT superfamily N-acetyltransferase [Planctomycetota bacterium]|jgi:GNAT superfamily N-acetyltransferase
MGSGGPFWHMVDLIKLSRLETGSEAELASFFDTYNREVGHYVGRPTEPDGHASLACLEAGTEGVTFELHKILFGPNEVGFLCTSMTEGEDHWVLQAIFVLPAYRRQRIATSALALIAEQWTGKWLVEYPLRLQEATQFVEGVMTILKAEKIGARESKREGLGTFRRIEVVLKPPLGAAMGSSSLLDGVRLPPAARQHHDNRRTVLSLAAFTLMSSMFLGRSSTGLGFFCLLASGVLWLVYLEMVITGIMDRLDRGPILAIKTRGE